MDRKLEKYRKQCLGTGFMAGSPDCIKCQDFIPCKALYDNWQRRITREFKDKVGIKLYRPGPKCKDRERERFGRVFSGDERKILLGVLREKAKELKHNLNNPNHAPKDVIEIMENQHKSILMILDKAKVAFDMEPEGSLKLGGSSKSKSKVVKEIESKEDKVATERKKAEEMFAGKSEEEQNRMLQEMMKIKG